MSMSFRINIKLPLLMLGIRPVWANGNSVIFFAMDKKSITVKKSIIFQRQFSQKPITQIYHKKLGVYHTAIL